MSVREQYWRYSLIAIILFLGIVIFKRISPLLGGLLGAVTAYTLLRGQMAFLVGHLRWRRGLAAMLMLVEAFVVCFIPIGLLVWVIVREVQHWELAPQRLVDSIRLYAGLIHEHTGYDMLRGDSLSWLIAQLSHWGQLVMEALSSLGINLFVMVIALYFMLIGGRRMEDYLFELLPFNLKNTQDVVSRIMKIVRSNAIGIPLQALIQGGIAMVGYWSFGVSDVVPLGIATSVASVIPIVGTSLVWIPVVFGLMLVGRWFEAIGLLLYGSLVVSQCDNLIRFILQKRMANTHPLITLFGVIIGLPLFGFMGIIFGPLLLSLFLLFVDMFKEQYVGSYVKRDDS